MQSSSSSAAAASDPHAAARQRARDENEADAAAASLPHGRSSASALQPARSVGQRCHTDALHCIFAFLPINSLLSALKTCRGWRDAAYREPARGLSFKLAPSLFPLLSAMPLRHHIRRIESRRRAVTLSELQALRSIPTLSELDVRLHPRCLKRVVLSLPRAARAATARACLPAGLNALTLRVKGRLPLKEQRLVIEIAGGMLALRSLHIHMRALTPLDVSSLAHLSNLEHLILSADLRLTNESWSALGQLANLRSLDVLRGAINEVQLQHLLAPGHKLALLNDINLEHVYVDETYMESLATLPSLSTLRVQGLSAEACAMLPTLRNLTSLWLNLAANILDEDFVAHLAQCARLRHLRLSSFSATQLNAHSLGLLLSMPALEHLQLHSVSVDLRELRAAVPARSALNRLTLESCSWLRSQHLLALCTPSVPPSLQRLDVQLRAREAEFASRALPGLMPGVDVRVSTVQKHDDVHDSGSSSSSSDDDDDDDEEDDEDDE